MKEIIASLLESDDPAVRLKVRVHVLGQDAYSLDTILQRQDIHSSPRVSALLSERGEDGRIPHHPYAKWRGAHWVLAALADIGYPPGDESLLPLRQQVYDWLLSPAHTRSIRNIDGRVRRCASQEGNALYYLLVLGLADERTEELAQRLIQWQWPDGGWNCDRKPEATNSSFMETLLPLRGLAWHNKLTGSGESMKAARRAANVFLNRQLYKRRSDGSVIREDFTKLHYPCYWHYDILCGLKVMAEAGLVRNPACGDALDLLQSKQLPGGGFPAEGRYYSLGESRNSGRSLVDWGPTGKTRMNEFVTADALQVLKEAGRIPWPLELPSGYEG